MNILDPNYCHIEIDTPQITSCFFIKLLHCEPWYHYTVFMKTEVGEENGFVFQNGIAAFPKLWDLERGRKTWTLTMSTNLTERKKEKERKRKKEKRLERPYKLQGSNPLTSRWCLHVLPTHKPLRVAMQLCGSYVKCINFSVTG